MTDNMFDKFVREKLRDHPSTVPPGLWEKIEKKRDNDPRGGFFLPGNIIWAGLFIIATSLGLVYYLMQKNDTALPGSQFSPTAAAKGSNAGGSNNNSNHNTNNSSIIPPTENNGDISADANNNSQSQTVTGGTRADQQTTLVVPDKQKTKAEANVAATKTKASETLLYRETNPQLKNLTSRFAKPAKNGASSLSVKAGSQDKYTSEPMTDISVSKLLLSRGNTAYRFNSIGNLMSEKSFNAAQFKPVGIDCPPYGSPRRNDWYLEIYGSPDLPTKKVTADGNNAYASKKDSTETTQLSYTAGFRISKSITQNLMLKTGLQYSQINERFDLRTENERRIITVVTIRTVVSSTGGDSTVRDTSTVQQIGYRLQRTYNRYRSIDIPLLLSYEFGNENLKFAVNAGAIINLYSWYTGNTLNDSLAVVSLNSKASGIYKQNIGIGLYAGFSMIKPISNRLDVFAEPYFRYNLSNMSKSAGLSQRFNAAGITFGIRYKLNRQRNGTN